MAESGVVRPLPASDGAADEAGVENGVVDAEEKGVGGIDALRRCTGTYAPGDASESGADQPFWRVGMSMNVGREDMAGAGLVDAQRRRFVRVVRGESRCVLVLLLWGGAG